MELRLMSTLKAFAVLKEELKTAREKVKESAKEAFSKAAKQIFFDHPGLESFSWEQYTPYWNDGEPCEFSANTEDPDVMFEGEEYEAYGDNELTPNAVKAEKAVAEFLGVFDDDDYEDIFGDHVRVTVTASGATTEEYSHG
jgi:hypothetical protein